MKVSVTFDLSEEARRAINYSYGRPGKATREQCLRYLLSEAKGMLEMHIARYRAEVFGDGGS
jgi:hypothetical protein